jgi:tetratricopeptide (TPR) repeat protein
MTTGSPAGTRVRWAAADQLEQRPRERFLPVLRAAVEAAPERPEPRRRLARMLLAMELFDELEELVMPELDDPGADGETLHCLGLGALATSEPDLALRALRGAVDRGYTASLGALANALYRLGRYDDAVAPGLRALELHPSDYSAGSVVARLLLERGEPERLWSACNGVRSRGDWCAYLPSALALSAQTDEQHREVERLVGRDRWVEHRDLGLPPEVNRRVREELLGLMGSGELPRRKASVGRGRRINQLHVLARTNPVLAELFDVLRATVEDYVSAREDALADPELAESMGGRRPDVLAFDSWALAMHDDGHEEWHLHPSGWLSGVYYVDVPDTSASAAPHPGEIEFGPFPFAGVAYAPAWPNWHVRPRTGDVLLFPSFYGHRTWPTGVADPRVVVPFDVLRAGPG